MPNQFFLSKIDSSSLTTSCTTTYRSGRDRAELHAKTSNYLKFIYSKRGGGGGKSMF